MAFGTAQPYQTNSGQSFLPSWARWLFVLIILLLAAAIVWVGWSAVRRHHFEFDWRSRTPGGEAGGVKTFDGAAAVLMGNGLMSFGAMLAIWGLALIMSFTRRESTPGDSRLLRGLAWASLACLLAAIICIFPPWQLQSIPFYSVLVLIDAFFFAVPDSSHQRWARLFFPLLVVAMMGTASLNIDAGAGMGIGLFASIGILAHLVMLFPRLQGRLAPETDVGR
jgi:hypothetical protein